MYDRLINSSGRLKLLFCSCLRMPPYLAGHLTLGMVTICAALRSVHGESDESLKPIVDALSASGCDPESEAVVAPCLHYIKPPLLCLWGLACVSSQCCLFALSTSRILHSEEVHLPEGDCYGTAPPQSGGYDWSYLG